MPNDETDPLIRLLQAYAAAPPSEPFVQSQQMMGFWRKAFEDHVTRVTAMSGEWDKLEGKSVEQASTLVDEAAKMTKETFAYCGQLATAWRKIMLEQTRKGLEMWSVASAKDRG